MVISKAEFLKHNFSEKHLLAVIALGSVSITAIDMYIYESGYTFGRVAYNGCLGRSHEFQVRKLSPVS
jgi:hypothetical protein